MAEIQVTHKADPTDDQTRIFEISGHGDLVEDEINFPDVESAGRSPLAYKVFGFPWADSVKIAPQFVSITKQDWVDWDVLADPLANLIKEHLELKQPVLFEKSRSGVSEEPKDMPPVEVRFEPTPNPNALKFVTNRHLSHSAHEFNTTEEAEASPFATKIFQFPWADGVFISQDFITIRKSEIVEWDAVSQPLADMIKEHMEQGLALFVDDSSSEISENDPPIVQQIKQILNQEIRPAVAMDGGDIVFQRFEDNRVYLHMKGSCAGCPSSTMTLKQGIESRLRERIPEVQEVIAI